MTAIRFTVPVSPVGVNQTYRTGRGRMFKSPEAEAYRVRLQLAARRAMRGREPLAGDVTVRLWFAFPSRRADIDGPVKPTLDALEGIVFANDRQVFDLQARKLIDPESPRVEVEVCP